MNEKIKAVLERTLIVVLSRSGDVDTEDGSFATVETDEIIHLETAIAEAFDLDSDNVSTGDFQRIKLAIDEL